MTLGLLKDTVVAELHHRALSTIAGVAVLFAALAACGAVSSGGGGAEAPSASKVTPPARPLASGPSELRSRSTADVIKGTVMRVSGVGQAIPGARLAGYLIRPGTERPLSGELVNELVTLVRSDSGLDDSIVKRCRPGTSVGFRLFRKPPSGSGSTNEPVTELVLDFGCDKLTVAEAGATGNPHSTYFDRSRAAFVAFVKRALPDDNELRKLRQPAVGRERQGK